MADTQTTPQTNEFGTKVDASVVDDGKLNQQGKETTLDEILAAVRGIKVPDAKADDKPDVAADTKDPVADAKSEFNTGNKALDVAVSSFVRSTGATDADIQRACENAIAYGDTALIDKAFLNERFKDRAPEALAIAEAVIEQASIEKQRTIDSVFKIAGGEPEWKTALGVYKQHAPAGLQKALQMMFDSGDAQSVQDAAQLVVDFAKGSGALVVNGNRMVGSGGKADAQGLSMAELQAAVGKLNTSSRTYQDDYKRLIELRRIGKQLGK